MVEAEHSSPVIDLVDIISMGDPARFDDIPDVQDEASWDVAAEALAPDRSALAEDRLPDGAAVLSEPTVSPECLPDAAETRAVSSVSAESEAETNFEHAEPEQTEADLPEPDQAAPEQADREDSLVGIDHAGDEQKAAGGSSEGAVPGTAVRSENVVKPCPSGTDLVFLSAVRSASEEKMEKNTAGQTRPCEDESAQPSAALMQQVDHPAGEVQQLCAAYEARIAHLEATVAALLQRVAQLEQGLNGTEDRFVGAGNAAMPVTFHDPAEEPVVPDTDPEFLVQAGEKPETAEGDEASRCAALSAAADAILCCRAGLEDETETAGSEVPGGMPEVEASGAAARLVGEPEKDACPVTPTNAETPSPEALSPAVFSRQLQELGQRVALLEARPVVDPEVLREKILVRLREEIDAFTAEHSASLTKILSGLQRRIRECEVRTEADHASEQVPLIVEQALGQIRSSLDAVVAEAAARVVREELAALTD